MLTHETTIPNRKPMIKGNILFIGYLAKDICSEVLDNQYNAFSLTNFDKAYYWLENQLIADRPLPKAIICDYKLIDGTAFSFFNRLKANKYLSHIAFIVLARDVSAHEKMKALKLGIDDFYVNTFSGTAICERIDFISKFKTQIIRKDYQREINLNYFIPIIKLPVAKRVIDLVIASLAMVFLSPLFLVIALLIKLESRGPVFYISKRAGTGYRIFDFYKFRTMRTDADQQVKHLMHLNQYSHKDGSKSAFVKIENDPRITKIGRFLRNTSLDELPQLINVLMGDMSLVGNRPLPLYEAELLTKDQWAKRFLAPAGITGLWQVTKRGRGGELSDDERMELDIAYADRASLWFDLVIILRTFPALFQRRAV